MLGQEGQRRLPLTPSHSLSFKCPLFLSFTALVSVSEVMKPFIAPDNSFGSSTAGHERHDRQLFNPFRLSLSLRVDLVHSTKV